MSVKRILADRPHTQPESGTRAGSDVPEDHYLPPRKVVHPTEKEKMAAFLLSVAALDFCTACRRTAGVGLAADQCIAVSMDCGSTNAYPRSSKRVNSVSSASAVQGSSCIKILLPGRSCSRTFATTCSGLLFFYRHFPVLGAVGPRHVQQPLLFGFSPDFLASRAERRTEESRGFPRNRFYRLLHISDLPIDLLFAFLLQVDMIPRVIAYRLSALVKELDNIRMLFNPVPVQEKKSLSLYACRAYPAASG